jgi:hypothetical protein
MRLNDPRFRCSTLGKRLGSVVQLRNFHNKNVLSQQKTYSLGSGLDSEKANDSGQACKSAILATVMRRRRIAELQA